MLGFEFAVSGVQLMISLVGIVGSGFSAYYGVRMALVRIEARQDSHGKDIARLDERITYLERHLYGKTEK